MIALVTVLSLAAAPAALVNPDPNAGHEAISKGPPACRSNLLKAGHDGTAIFRRLADLPDANLEVAVLRLVGDCQAPLIVSYKVSR